MKISEHIISQENGTEYFKIIFNVYNKIDISIEDYKEIEWMIEQKLHEINETKKATL